ncbi:MAG: LON peptidase substrate-binding domain-containing protein [Hahellaceae bacterium]|nr:LON peptidase substrate-binding domain-containing protein [Hahellaceae bacterium]MCP5169888.1 LON peptidase substrate-binding domain-containing protein [Hahellaceae bacterium]
MLNEVPLFPLNSIIFPGGRLPLRLFEPRYLDMVANALRQQTGFVIVLIKEGNEVGQPCEFYSTGTLVKIIDFSAREDGLLGITVEGTQKVTVTQFTRQSDGLYVGALSGVDQESFMPVQERFCELVDLLQALSRHPAVSDLALEIDYQDSRDVGWRLTELLPLARKEKQYLFELEDPVYRLEQIRGLLSILQE